MFRSARVSLLIVLALSVLGLQTCVGQGASDQANDVDLSLALLATQSPYFSSGSDTDPYFSITESDVAAPERIEGAYYPIGRVYDISLNRAYLQEVAGRSFQIPEGQITFYENDMARIVYKYDPDTLAEAGLIPEFAAFYYDYDSESWRHVDRLEVNTNSFEVTAYTSHLTPFVLTAIAAPPGPTTPQPPECLAADYPGGVGGSGAATFMTVGPDFQYYLDRDYRVVRNAALDSLGFEDAIGIATCNGNSFCGPFNDHKTYTGTDYIQFNAHTDLDVYIMYDTRGGANINDDSNDAAWIQAQGFVNTGLFIETTDAVQFYRVYRRTYNQGDAINLHGNNNGVGSPAINTNYWVVLKRAGDTGVSNPSSMCVTAPVLNPPVKVFNLKGVPGSDQALLSWSVPNHPDFDGVVVRRSETAAPAYINLGDTPAGFSPDPQHYIDQGLANNRTYFYSVFAVYNGSNYYPVASVSVRTGIDSDGDDISDVYEDTTVYPTALMSDRNQTDSDGDGITDFDELLAGTDPTNPDATAPVITVFTLDSPTPTDYPLAIFTLDSADADITHWMVTENTVTPLADNPGWNAVKPTGFPLSGSGTHTLFAYAKDAAGNVSAPRQINVELNGIRSTDGVFVSGPDSLVQKLVGLVRDLATGALTANTQRVDQTFIQSRAVHPNGRYIYEMIRDDITGTFHLTVSRIDSGGLVELQRIPATQIFEEIVIHPRGHALYAFFGDDIYLFNIDTGTFLLTDQGQTFAGASRNLKLDGYRARMLFHPNYKYAYVAAYNTTYRRAVALFETDPSTGALTYRSIAHDGLFSYNGSDPIYSLAMSNDSRFLYSIALYNSGASIIEKYRIPPDGGQISFWTAVPVPRGWFMVARPQSDAVYYIKEDQQTIVRVPMHSQIRGALDVSQITEYPVPTQIWQLRLDATGQNLYAISTADQEVLVYRVDDSDGSLALVQTYPLSASHIPREIVMQSRVNTNDPPIIHAENVAQTHGVPTTVIYMPQPYWDRVGHMARFTAAQSFDPDADKCNADPANYTYEWSLIDKPATSALNPGTTDITDSNQLVAGFVPDVAGWYTVEFRFTDDPGTCAAFTARTSSATVRIHAGYLHQGAVAYDLSVYSPTPSSQHVPAFADMAYMHSIAEHGDLNVLWCIGPLQCAPVCQRFGWEKNLAHQSCAQQINYLPGLFLWNGPLFWRYYVEYHWYEETPP
ncbi:MAG: hypothetical protein KDK34_10970 [Leptospiraceae bacterium]|nr:hypothetical protein [Leptospiraceae bacterium]